MKEQYWFHYKSTSGDCKEGPYTLTEALARRLSMGQTAQNWIELETSNGKV